MDSQCLVCQDIEEFVNQIIQYWSVPLKRDGRANRTLGPYRNRMNCTACQEVFQSIQFYSQQVNATLLQPECSLEILLFSDRYPQIQIGGKRVSLHKSSRGFKQLASGHHSVLVVAGLNAHFWEICLSWNRFLFLLVNKVTNASSGLS
jgi:hypothetical protein